MQPRFLEYIVCGTNRTGRIVGNGFFAGMACESLIFDVSGAYIDAEYDRRSLAEEITGMLGKEFIVAANRGMYFISVDDDEINAKKSEEEDTEVKRNPGLEICTIEMGGNSGENLRVWVTSPNSDYIGTLCQYLDQHQRDP